jgi:hypothetical protein
MALTIFCIYLTGAAYWAIVQGAVGAEHVGAASGFVHLIANSAGIIGPAVTGVILLAGVIALLGALAVAAFVKRA